MKPRKKVEKAIRGKLRFTAGATFRDRLLTDVMNAREESNEMRPALHEPGIRRTFMRSSVAKLTSIAAVVAVAALSIVFWGRLSTPAYAIEQTVEALQNVRFLHIIGCDEAGEISDERWIEIGEDGYQVRYRQQNPLSVIEKHPGVPSMVIEDGESTAVYRQEKKAVIIYDRSEMQYQWVGQLGKAFDNLLQEGKVLEENSEYQGRLAHKVWWPYMSAECYVDPETKLPMAIGDTELSYEEPPAGAWEITIPDGFVVIDKRPGATPTTTPDWLIAEENTGETKGESFRQGVEALIRSDYTQAAKQLEQALGYDSWATFWLGSAYYGLGQYDLAAEYFTEMLNTMLKAFGGDVLPYCNYALGLAQAKAGNLEAAKANFEACLPAMIQTLRIPSGGKMFEYADNPKIRCGQHKLSDEEMVVKMINRLRIITGQNFGYDPNGAAKDNEAAIAAWEQWFQTDGQIRFTPDAELLPVPVSSDGEQTNANN
jgi:tetratricopeptide (TPR) repeat protein